MNKSEIALYGAIVRVFTDEPPYPDEAMIADRWNEYVDRMATRLVEKLVATPALLDTIPPPSGGPS